jgi:hypothetical protein
MDNNSMINNIKSISTLIYLLIYNYIIKYYTNSHYTKLIKINKKINNQLNKLKYY